MKTIMKLKNFILIFVIFFICSCTSTNVVYNAKPTVVTVEDIQYNVTNNKGKYVIKAWSKYPKIKQYKIYSDLIYNIGDTIIINK